MVSPELIRRYSFFADLTMEQIVTLARLADEKNVETEQFIFHEGEELAHFFVVLEGKVGILVNRPDPDVIQPVSRQLAGNLIETRTVVSVIEPGEVFGWSALVPPHAATSGTMALVPSRILSFDCYELKQAFKSDCQFGYLMMRKMAQVIRDRLRDMRIESLSTLVPHVG